MITQTTTIQMGLSFDDVLLVPQRTRVKSRSDKEDRNEKRFVRYFLTLEKICEPSR